MVISGERIREIAARELERHVHDFRSVLKELVQQGEEANSIRLKNNGDFF
jgi:hypothetical protein